MAQITNGIRTILSDAWAYRLLQGLLGASSVHRFVVSEISKSIPGERVLDIGCGPGDVLEYLPEVDYIGLDMNHNYISAAHKRWGKRGKFICTDLREYRALPGASFDLIFLLGILHHLDDHEVSDIIREASHLLRPGGRLITLDTCFCEGQSRIARWLISKDRGRNTRTVRGYCDLVEPYFESVTPYLRGNLLRVPYTHLILRCCTCESQTVSWE